MKSKIYALRDLEGGDWFSGSRTQLGSQKVPHMWYPCTQEKQQNVFWGAIPHITMACVSNISFSDNFFFFLLVIIQSPGAKNIYIQWAQHASQQIAWGVFFPKWGHLGGLCDILAFYGLQNCDR